MEWQGGIGGRMKRTAIDGLGSEEMTITPLGAGSEVGRSCIVLKFKGKTIMVFNISHFYVTAIW